MKNDYKEKVLTTLNDTPIKVLIDKRLKDTQGLVYQVSYVGEDKPLAVNIGQTNQVNGEKRPKNHVNDLRDLSAQWLALNESKVKYVVIDLLEKVGQRKTKKETIEALEEREGFYNLQSIKKGIIPLNDFKVGGKKYNARLMLELAC